MLAAQESASPVVVIGCLALGAWMVFHGVQTWRGREPASFERARRQGKSTDWIFGGRRQYQTFLGAGLMGIPGGLGFIIIAIGVSVRDLLDQPEDWGPWYAAAVVGFILIAIGGIYSLAYFFTGVPDWLRPPSQRGASPPGRLRDHR